MNFADIVFVLIGVAIFGGVVWALTQKRKRDMQEYAGGAGSDTGGIDDWDKPITPKPELPMAE